ncbi:MAG TPA: NUDIX domain-containing protein [Chloroflexota bacterium]|nr:NUDIX domain-containing protein [Chloroflexota bacterium]
MKTTRPGSTTTTSPESPGQPTRDFTVATFVVSQERVLLLWHRKLQKWLPPGGHVEANELPDNAAIREVREETGLAVELLGERGVPIAVPRQLIRPAGIQLEDIAPGHQHIDLIYFARPADPSSAQAVGNHESEAVGWFTLAEMPQRGVLVEIQLWAERAVQAVRAESSRTSRPSAR